MVGGVDGGELENIFISEGGTTETPLETGDVGGSGERESLLRLLGFQWKHTRINNPSTRSIHQDMIFLTGTDHLAYIIEE